MAALAWSEVGDPTGFAGLGAIYLVRAEQPKQQTTAATSLPALAWLPQVMERLGVLRHLKPGWDGYSARAIRDDVTSFVLGLLQSILKPSAPVPDLVPLASGGIQLCWYRNGIELDLFVERPNAVVAVFEDIQAGTDAVERAFETDYRELARWIDRAG
jgi:hypothetical protein